MADGKFIQNEAGRKVGVVSHVTRINTCQLMASQWMSVGSISSINNSFIATIRIRSVLSYVTRGLLNIAVIALAAVQSSLSFDAHALIQSHSVS